MNWNTVLQFARGPFFAVALLIFIAGMMYRLITVILLGFTRDRIPPAGSKGLGVLKSYLKGILAWPFIPWVKQTFMGNPVMFLAGGLFHLSLFTVTLFGTAHVLVWKSLLGFAFPSLPLPIVDFMAAVGIIAMVALLILRFTHPVLKKITGVPEILNWAFVFVPMVTGYITTHHLFFRYEVLFSIHMLAIDALLIYIPFSRIAHFMFYFFARTIHGTEFGKRAVNP